jgi:hypothetical protein
MNQHNLTTPTSTPKQKLIFSPQYSVQFTFKTKPTQHKSPQNLQSKYHQHLLQNN